MKKRVLSALLVLCMACSMVSTVWADPAASDGTEPVQKNVASSQALDETGAADGSEETQSGDSELVLSDTTADEKEAGAATGSEETAPISGDESMEPDGDIADSTTESDNGSNLPATSQPNNSIANESDTPNLLATGEYSIYQGETITLSSSRVINEWSATNSDGQVEITHPDGVLGSDKSTAYIKGTVPGTVTVTHKYGISGLGGGEDTYIIHVSDRALVFVYVAARVTNQDGTPVTDKYGNQLSWADNPEFLEMLGLDKNTVDAYGYFPVGQVLVPYEGLLDQESPYLNDENDWSVVTDALANLDTNALNNTYAANRGNSIADYRQQAIHDFSFEGSQQRSALFETSGSSNGFDRQAGYHLDLRFNTNTITFIAGNNGIGQGQPAADGTTIEQRVYITGSSIQKPKEFPIPEGYKLVGYYEDPDFTTEWNGIGTPLNENETVYIKIEPKDNVTITYQVAEGEGTLSRDYEAFNPETGNPQGATATSADGYAFDGWYSDEDCTELVSKNAAFVPQAPQGGWPEGEDYIYYAKFNKLEPLNLDHSKYVKANKDGTFDLTLDVTGAVGEGEVQTQNLDILYVLDNSTSMKDNYMKDSQGEWTSYLKAAKDAINALEEVLGENQSLNVRHSLVVFSGHGEDYIYTHKDWCDLSEDLGLDKVGGNGNGTNYQEALQQAFKQLNPNKQGQAIRSDADQVVIFLSDGEPNLYKGHYYNEDYSGAKAAALTEVKNLQAERFYAIGVGSSIQTLYDLVDNATGVTKDKHCWSSTQSDQLEAIFRNMAQEMTRPDCSNVTITDTLSTYAKLTNGAAFTVTAETSGDPAVEITSAPIPASSISSSGYEGNLIYWVSSQDNHITAEEPGKSEQQNYTEHTIPFKLTYNSTQKQFTLSFGTEEAPYTLESNWTYSITTQIEPTEQAYTDYRTNIATEGNNGYGETVGDPDTDALGNTTSSGQPGFYSNSSAKLTYISNGVSADKDYARPVIQVTTGTLSLEKAVNVDAAKEKDFTFTITKLDGDTNNTDADFTYTFDGVAFENGVATVIVKGGQTLSMTGLPSGRYTVAENNSSMPSVDGYNLTGTTYQVEGESASTPVTVQVNAAGTANVTVTNTYAPQYQTLTVTKTVGGEMGSYEQDFTFTLHLTKDGATYTGDDITGTKSLLNGTGAVPGGVTKFMEGGTTYYQFTLKHNQKIEIQIPYGCVAEVEEANGNYTAESVLDTSTNKGGATVTGINMSTDHKVAYTNTLDPVAPTGLESNHTTPYVLMITAAGMAGLALIGGIVARRVRRRRQE